ncbi:hypothetical protein OAO16_03555, partial [Opitutales bacterium]|nr:hypothetical protein [Opitutales bacterium]
PFGNNTHTIITNVTSEYPLEYVEFFDNGRLFDTPASIIDENGTFHRGRAIEFDAPPYVASWTSSELGEHILYARYTDTKGNSFISNLLKVKVAPPIGQTPEGTLTLYHRTPNNNQPTRVSVGSTLLAYAEFVDPDSISQNVDSADFYLNGSLISSQSSPPFFVQFSPTAIQNTSLPKGSWELSAVGKDEDGNQVELKSSGLMEGAVSLPSAEMKLSSSNNFDVYDNGLVRMSVVSVGNPDSLAALGEMAFFANGLSLGTDQGIIKLDEADNVIQKTYDFEFSINYLLHAKNNGSVTISGLAHLDYNQSISGMLLGYDPIIATNEIKLNIIVPRPWSEPTTTVGDVIENLGLNISPSELTVIEGFTKEEYYRWLAEKLQLSAFQQQVDLLAAHKIALGKWFNSYQEFDDDIQYYLKSNAPELPPATTSALLKHYIDDLLQGIDYRSKFGQLPYLVGSWFNKDIYNYPFNRRNFVAQCLQNKYDQPSLITQDLQGSKKLLSFWGGLEPTYWEISGLKPTLAPANSIEADPPRRDSGYAILNNFGQDRYFSGELSVELIWRLATEVKTNGLPYILYTDDIRSSIFTSATLMSLLWQEKWNFSMNDIQKISNLSLSQKISYVMNDSLFYAKFNDLWKKSRIPNLNYPFWKFEEWFGAFNDSQFPWIYHTRLGWLFCEGRSTDSVWFYSPKYGWLWTSRKISTILPPESKNYLYFYRHSGNDWIIFKKEAPSYSLDHGETWLPVSD